MCKWVPCVTSTSKQPSYNGSIPSIAETTNSSRWSQHKDHLYWIVGQTWFSFGEFMSRAHNKVCCLLRYIGEITIMFLSGKRCRMLASIIVLFHDNVWLHHATIMQNISHYFDTNNWTTPWCQTTSPTLLEVPQLSPFWWWWWWTGKWSYKMASDVDGWFLPKGYSKACVCYNKC